MNGICFQIHHLPGLNKLRDETVIKNKEILSEFFTNLNLKTVLIQNENDYNNFIKENKNFKAKLSSFPEGLGDVGLWASYYQSIKKFIETDFEYLISIQDEAIIFENFSKLLFNYLKKLPSDTDFIYLDRLHSPLLATYNKAYKHYEINDTVWISHHWYAGETILFTKQGANKFVNYVENNIIGNYIDCILLDFNNLPTINVNNDGDIFFLMLKGEMPKIKNKKFNSYSLSPTVQPIAASFRSHSIIRELHLK